MQSDYATMLGYTQRELEENFVEEIEMAAIHLQLSTSLSITNKSVHWMQDRALASGFWGHGKMLNNSHKSNFEDLWVIDRP